MTISNVFPCVKKIVCLTCCLESDLKFTLGWELTNYQSNMQRKHILICQCLFSGCSQVSFQLDVYTRKKLLPMVTNKTQLGLGMYHSWMIQCLPFVKVITNPNLHNTPRALLSNINPLLRWKHVTDNQHKNHILSFYKIKTAKQGNRLDYEKPER